MKKKKNLLKEGQIPRESLLVGRDDADALSHPGWVVLSKGTSGRAIHNHGKSPRLLYRVEQVAAEEGEIKPCGGASQVGCRGQGRAGGGKQHLFGRGQGNHHHLVLEDGPRDLAQQGASNQANSNQADTELSTSHFSSSSFFISSQEFQKEKKVHFSIGSPSPQCQCS